MMPPSREDGRPSFPINLVADYAGGGLMAVTGVLLALMERHKSGLGQVVEVDMVGIYTYITPSWLTYPFLTLQVSGTRYVSSFPLVYQALRSPFFSSTTGNNLLDGGSPYYGVYRCNDGGWFTVGALEPRFYATFLELFIAALPAGFSVPGLERGLFWKPSPQNQLSREEWGDLRAFFEAGFMTRPRDEWTEIFDGW